MLRLSTVTVDLARGLVERDDGIVALAPREVAVLRFLSRRAGEVVSRDELLRHVFGQPDDSLSRVVDSVVCRLRHKIEEDPARPRHLLTEFGEGYRLRARASGAATAARSARRALAFDAGTACLDTGRLDRHDGGVHTLVGVELGLLRELVASAGRVVDASALERRVWGNVLARSNRLRNLIYRLRGRIEADPRSPRHLLAVRGRGYRFVVSDDAPATGVITVLAARVEPAASAELWQAVIACAARTGGYVAPLDGGRARVVWSASGPAVEAAEALSAAVPGARVVVVTGRATRLVEPMSGRHTWVGEVVDRAERALQGALPEPAAERGAPARAELVLVTDGGRLDRPRAGALVAAR